ncbi:MAG: hypothetical protein PUI34_09120, partial [Hornefia butyriciproducens]|nr:hypothetical protein [Hornefia butyriciproducens]
RRWSLGYVRRSTRPRFRLAILCGAKKIRRSARKKRTKAAKNQNFPAPLRIPAAVARLRTPKYVPSLPPCDPVRRSNGDRAAE